MLFLNLAECGKRFDRGGVKGFDAFVDARSDFGLAGVGHREHFQFGVEIVDHVEGDGFRRLGLDGRTELKFPVMRGDEVKEVQADIIRSGLDAPPGLERQLAPEGVHRFDTDADVPEKLTAQLSWDFKPRLRWTHFPEFPAVVKKNTGEQQVTVENRVGAANGRGGTHHLSSVAKQTAAVGVVIVPRGGGPLEAGSEFLEKQFA